MKNSTLLSLMAALAAGFITNARADSTTTGFGTAPSPVPAAPYGGSGIPVNTSEYSIVSGVSGPNALAPLDTVGIDLAATQYKDNSAPGNNGAGTYYVTPGVGADAGRSTWNFDFNVSSAQSRISDYTFSLTELNVGNGESFSFDPTLAILGDNPSGSASDGNSESLDFSAFGTPIGYNINANDTYDFTLTASQNGVQFASDSIAVVDGTGANGSGAGVPDKTPTAGILAASFAGLIFMRTRGKKRISRASRIATA